MRTFVFEALTLEGVCVAGRELAQDLQGLDRSLERRGLTLTRAQPLQGQRGAARARLKRDELVAFTSQLATMVTAGLPLVEGLEGIASRTPRPQAREVVEGLVFALREGLPLSEAMTQHPGSFPPVYQASVRAGESSGALDQVLRRMVKHLEWVRMLRATTVQTMIYPLILALAVLGLLLVLMLFVLPRISDLFPAGRGALPWQTQAVLGASAWAVESWPWLAGGAVLSVVVAALALRRESARRAVDRVWLATPKLGDLVRSLAISRFASTASTLQAAGCDVFTMLSIAGGTCGNRAIARVFERVAQAARRGATLTQSLAAEPLVDPLLVQLVHVGERSGDLAGCLDRLVEYYDAEIPRRVKRFLALLEPSMLIGAAFVVGFVLLASLLPIFKLYESLG